MRIKSFVLAALLMPVAAFAAGGGHYESADTDIHNVESLQRGARNFVNYCLGCHSAEYVRWNRVGEDLGLSEKDLVANLIPEGGTPLSMVLSPMPKAQAAEWFGNTPPDLSLIARSRGTDRVYTFLKSFYADPTRPHGVNNTVLPGTVMPHVLAHLQGLQQPKYEEVTKDGQTEKHLAGFVPGTPGELTAEQYDEFVRDTVNFLDYIGEPVKAERQRLGVWVLLFLLVFFLISYLLKKEYWKDVR